MIYPRLSIFVKVFGFLVISFCLSITINPATAASDSSNLREEAPIAILYNEENGESYKLPVRMRTERMENDQLVIEYSVDIPKSVLGEQSDFDYDQTRSAVIYIVKVYSSRIVNLQTYISVSQYKGKWERLDPLVTCTKMEVTATCNGPYLEGGNCDQLEETRVVNYPGNNVWYTKTPSWHGLFVGAISDLVHQSGYTRVTLKRGNTTWTFQMTVCHGGDLCGG